jgi:hypothetical protein
VHISIYMYIYIKGYVYTGTLFYLTNDASHFTSTGFKDVEQACFMKNDLSERCTLPKGVNLFISCTFCKSETSG